LMVGCVAFPGGSSARTADRATSENTREKMSGFIRVVLERGNDEENAKS
jgi:hypothetical protein